MSYVLVVLVRAELDIKQAYSWYEAQSEGLGTRFLDDVNDRLDAITAHPKAYQLIHRKARRNMLHSFPYGIYFTVEGDLVVVHGCVHASRDPKVWKRRL